jgi:hypothetical protein
MHRRVDWVVAERESERPVCFAAQHVQQVG